MKTPFDHFREKISIFQPTLEKLGYVLTEVSEKPQLKGVVSLNFHFSKSGLQLWLGTDWNEKENFISWSFSMFTDLPRRSFFLDYFVEDFGIHSLTDDKLTDLSCIEQFYENFFNELNRGAETYLKDQLTGAVFHDHRDRLMQIYYDSLAASQLLSDTTLQLKRQYHGFPIKQWFWRLVYYLFPNFKW